MANYRALLKEAEIEISNFISEYSKVKNSHFVVQQHLNTLNSIYSKSDKAKDDNHNLEADKWFLVLNAAAYHAAQENPALNHLTKVLFAGQGAIKQIIAPFHDDIEDPAQSNDQQERLKNFCEGAKYHYKREADKYTDPVKKVYAGINEILGHFGNAF
jgi:hypothetical protein